MTANLSTAVWGLVAACPEWNVCSATGYEQMPSGSDHALNMTRWQVVKTVVKCIFPKSLGHRQGMGNVKFL